MKFVDVQGKVKRIPFPCKQLSQLLNRVSRQQTDVPRAEEVGIRVGEASRQGGYEEQKGIRDGRTGGHQGKVGRRACPELQGFMFSLTPRSVLAS